jgi:hypothetical protein
MAFFVDRYNSMLIDHEFGDTKCKQEDVTSIQQSLDYNKGWDQNNDIDFWNRAHNYTNRKVNVVGLDYPWFADIAPGGPYMKTNQNGQAQYDEKQQIIYEQSKAPVGTPVGTTFYFNPDTLESTTSRPGGITSGNNTEGYKGVCNTRLMDSCNQNNRLGLCNLNYINNDTMYLSVYDKKGSKKSLYKNVN